MDSTLTLALLFVLSFVLIAFRIQVAVLVDEAGISFDGAVGFIWGLISLGVEWQGDQLSIRPRLVGLSVWTIRPGTKAEKEEEQGEASGEEVVGEEAPEVEKSLRERIGEILEYDRRFRGVVLAFLSRLVDVIRIASIRADGEYGTGSAEATGTLYGYVAACDGATSNRLNLNLRPVFTRSGFIGSAEIDIRLFLRRLLWAVACAAVGVGWGVVGMRLNQRVERRRMRRRLRVQAA